MDEKKFRKAMESASVFSHVASQFNIGHPTLPSCFLEVDNLGVKKDVLYIFEGKHKNESAAIQQLKVRYQSLLLFRHVYVNHLLPAYSTIKLYFYSLAKHSIVEYDSKGKKITSMKFADVPELINILRNI